MSLETPKPKLSPEVSSSTTGFDNDQSWDFVETDVKTPLSFDADEVLKNDDPHDAWDSNKFLRFVNEDDDVKYKQEARQNLEKEIRSNDLSNEVADIFPINNEDKEEFSGNSLVAEAASKVANQDFAPRPELAADKIREAAKTGMPLRVSVDGEVWLVKGADNSGGLQLLRFDGEGGVLEMEVLRDRAVLVSDSLNQTTKEAVSIPSVEVSSTPEVVLSENELEAPVFEKKETETSSSVTSDVETKKPNDSAIPSYGLGDRMTDSYEVKSLDYSFENDSVRAVSDEGSESVPVKTEKSVADKNTIFIEKTPTNIKKLQFAASEVTVLNNEKDEEPIAFATDKVGESEAVFISDEVVKPKTFFDKIKDKAADIIEDVKSGLDDVEETEVKDGEIEVVSESVPEISEIEADKETALIEDEILVEPETEELVPKVAAVVPRMPEAVETSPEIVEVPEDNSFAETEVEKVVPEVEKDPFVAQREQIAIQKSQVEALDKQLKEMVSALESEGYSEQEVAAKSVEKRRELREVITKIETFYRTNPLELASYMDEVMPSTLAEFLADDRFRDTLIKKGRVDEVVYQDALMSRPTSIFSRLSRIYDNMMPEQNGKKPTAVLIEGIISKQSTK